MKWMQGMPAARADHFGRHAGWRGGLARWCWAVLVASQLAGCAIAPPQDAWIGASAQRACDNLPAAADRPACWAAAVVGSWTWRDFDRAMQAHFESPLQPGQLAAPCQAVLAPPAAGPALTAQDRVDLCITAAFQALGGRGSLVKTSAADDADGQGAQATAAFGLGLQQRWPGQPVMVAFVTHGAAAQRAGVLPGDQLLAVDTTDLTPLATDAVIARFKGASGSLAQVRIQRGGVQRTLQISRAPVPAAGVAAQALGPGVVWLRVGLFADKAAAQMLAAVAQTLAEPPAPSGVPPPPGPALVLDLRGNAGGLLPPLLDAAALLVPAGTPLLQVVHRQGTDSFSSPAATTGRTGVDATRSFLRTARLVVLVDKRSANSVEALAAILRTHRAARLVGTSTAGINQVRQVSHVALDRAVVFPKGRLGVPGVPPWAPGGLQVDETTAAAAVGADPDDPALAAALRWLADQRR